MGAGTRRQASIVSALAFLALLAADCAATPPRDHETWRCDAPYGQYRDNTLPIDAAATTITGRILVHDGHRGPRWPSMAKIGFIDSLSTDAGCHCNGVRVDAFPGAEDATFSMLVDGVPIALSGRDIGIPITFSIAIVGDIRMTVTIGKATVISKAIAIRYHRDDRLAMSCSGADVSFLNVVVQ